MPSAATAVPSPHALTTSSSANALTTVAIAELSFFRSMCRLRTIDSSRADTPEMCRAASYGPMLIPPVNTAMQYLPRGSAIFGSDPPAGPKWWCQPSQ